MIRRSGGWQRVGSVAPATDELSGRRRDELALLAAWQRVAGQPLATHVVPRLERATLVLEVVASDWLPAVRDVARRLAAGVAAALAPGAVEEYVVCDHEGTEVKRGSISEAAAARARSLQRGSIATRAVATRHERAPLIAEPSLAPDERSARLLALRDRYLERGGR